MWYDISKADLIAINKVMSHTCSNHSYGAQKRNFYRGVTTSHAPRPWAKVTLPTILICAGGGREDPEVP